MGQYMVPPDTSAKEKIVGGVLTAAQLCWLLGGVGAGAIFAFLTFGLFGRGSIIIGTLFLPVGGVFAFVKKHELTLFDYLLKRRQHNKKIKHLPNYRKEVKF